MSDIKLKIDGYEVHAFDEPYLFNNEVTGEGQAFAKAIIKEIPKAKIAVVDKLLKLYNETWLDEGIGILTKEKFMAFLVNPSITLYDEIGAAALYFEASEMFTDHAIEVSFDEHIISGVSII